MASTAHALLISEEEYTRQFRLYYRRTLVYARNKFRSVPDPENMVAEGWSLAWFRRRQFQGQSSFLTWVSKIIFNQFLTALRKASETYLENIPYIPVLLDLDTPIELNQVLRCASNEARNRLVCDMEGTLVRPSHATTVQLCRDRRLVKRRFSERLKSLEARN